jgi:hypothetical protein
VATMALWGSGVRLAVEFRMTAGHHPRLRFRVMERLIIGFSFHQYQNVWALQPAMSTHDAS